MTSKKITTAKHHVLFGLAVYPASPDGRSVRTELHGGLSIGAAL